MSDTERAPPPVVTDTRAEDRVGWQLGGVWDLEMLIGVGGTAAVYAASDGKGNRVAIKVLHGTMAERDELRARFGREAKVANLIPHKGVVRVFEEGIADDGCPYLAMELLEGETYEERWERKGHRLSIGEVIWVGDQVLSVLVAAHKLGVVHRDIKPENIFLTDERVVRLLDFGIAGFKDLAATDDGATRMGNLMGTPAFMPPEQARGDWKQVGAETDLWAVGATMYTLLSGHLVHEEARLYDQLRAATTQPAPSLAVVLPDAPPSIVDLIDFALAFDGKKRWPNARSMQNALRVAYGEWKRTSGDDPVPMDEALEMTERPIRLERPDAPPPSLARPSRF